jgi:putative flippase GtrA
MPVAPEKIAEAVLRLVPAPLERKLRTGAGKRFTRFVPVALAGVITSQIMLAILVGPAQVSAGLSGVIASMTAALVSYLLSRWAWERKGKPDLLRETLPFWAVSVGVWLILGMTSHYASVWAHSMDYTHWRRHLVVQGSYFVMNCFTFVARFLIFNYILFASRSRTPAIPAPELAPELAPAEAAAGGSQDTGPIALLTGDPAGKHRASQLDRARR